MNTAPRIILPAPTVTTETVTIYYVFLVPVINKADAATQTEAVPAAVDNNQLLLAGSSLYPINIE